MICRSQGLIKIEAPICIYKAAFSWGFRGAPHGGGKDEAAAEGGGNSEEQDAATGWDAATGRGGGSADVRG